MLVFVFVVLLLPCRYAIDVASVVVGVAFADVVVCCVVCYVGVVGVGDVVIVTHYVVTRCIVSVIVVVVGIAFV